MLLRAVALSLAIGIALALLAPLVSRAGAWFIGAEPRVLAAMDSYVRIRLLGAPFALANYAMLGYVLGRGQGQLGLFLQLVLNGANIVLAIVLGLELGWGVAGVAWAAVSRRADRARRRHPRPGPAFPRRVMAVLAAASSIPPAMLAMMTLNRDIMIRSFVLLAAFALFTRQGAQFGTLTLAANAVLMNFFLVGGYFLDGFASAAEQLAGRAIGAGSRRAFTRAIAITTVWGFALSGHGHRHLPGVRPRSGRHRHDGRRMCARRPSPSSRGRPSPP